MFDVEDFDIVGVIGKYFVFGVWCQFVDYVDDFCGVDIEYGNDM